MSANSRSKWSNGRETPVLKKLLGSLELEAMEYMWQAGDATVQKVVKAIYLRRPIAYTSVMTVMGHLVGKGLLSRTMEGKRYLYRVVQGRNEFLHSISRKMVRTMVDDFGDIAISQFLGEVDNIDADKLDQLRKLIQGASGDSSTSE